MVKANRTVSFCNAAARADEFGTLDQKSARVALRKDDVRSQAIGERAVASGPKDVRGEQMRRAPAPAGVGEYIGRELRGLYDDVVAQPVPDRFLALLNKLESESLSAGDDAARLAD